VKSASTQKISCQINFSGRPDYTCSLFGRRNHVLCPFSDAVQLFAPVFFIELGADFIQVTDFQWLGVF